MTRRIGPAPVLGVAIVATVGLMAVLGPLIAPYGPNDQVLRDRLLPPAWLAGGAGAHLFGTDGNGRDLLSLVIHGSRVTLLVALMSTLVGGTIGVTAGVVAGWSGGWVDAVLGRLADVQQAIPFVVLVLAVVAVVGSSLVNLVAVLGIGSWLFYFRIVRGEALRIRELPWVEAARAVGSSPRRIVVRQVLPNVAPAILVVVSLYVPQTIVYTAGLSFLGLGVPPPTPEWGRLIADGSDNLRSAWWLTLVPSAFLVATVLGINLVGDWLRDQLDPVTRGQRLGARRGPREGSGRRPGPLDRMDVADLEVTRLAGPADELGRRSPEAS